MIQLKWTQRQQNWMASSWRLWPKWNIDAGQRSNG